MLALGRPHPVLIVTAVQILPKVYVATRLFVSTPEPSVISFPGLLSKQALRLHVQIRWGHKPDGVCLVVGACNRGFDPAANTTGDLIFTTEASLKRSTCLSVLALTYPMPRMRFSTNATAQMIEGQNKQQQQQPAARYGVQ